jgi:hypothetical protein
MNKGVRGLLHMFYLNISGFNGVLGQVARIRRVGTDRVGELMD